MATVKRKGFEVTKRLKNLKSGKGVRQALMEAAGQLIVGIRANWKAGIGANGKTLQSPRINEKYRERKKERLGVEIIDMYSPAKRDHMADYLKVTKLTNEDVTIGFTTETSQKKAGYNYETRPQFFTLGGALEKQIRNLVKKLLTGQRI